jgi:hypothetical protein
MAGWGRFELSTFNRYGPSSWDYAVPFKKASKLRAVDAFWLGLIDEVIDMTSLLVARYIVEYQADPEPAGPKFSGPDGDQPGK